MRKGRALSPEIRQQLAKVMREHCREHQTSMAALSLQAGFSKCYVVNLTNGYASPSKEALYRLADYVDFPPSLFADLARHTRGGLRKPAAAQPTYERQQRQPWHVTVKLLKKQPHISARAWA